MSRSILGTLAISLILAVAGCDSSTKTDVADIITDQGNPTDRGTDTTVTDLPRTDYGTPDTPAVDTPVVDTPVVDTPVVDTPVVDTPVVDTPATDTPVVTGCTGACDPATDAASCMADGTTVCACNQNVWTPVTCSDFCATSGGTGTQCTTTADGPNCECAWDCTDTAAVTTACTNTVYTKCTCGAADPCKWLGDNYCDDACATQYPADFFADTADCDCGNATAVDAACQGGGYTKCTCAAADPCGWVGDEYCDGPACAEAFPGQTNLDDSATDCTGV
jgi:hypothetical protein